jgi:hypothetical protein
MASAIWWESLKFQLAEELSWIQQIRLRVGIAARVCAIGARFVAAAASGSQPDSEAVLARRT